MLLLPCYPMFMSRTIEAEYLAKQNVLKLTEPLTGVRDHSKLAVEITALPTTESQPWMALSGSLDGQSGREVARAVNEAFGREIEV
jgi:hypothetical protein